MNKIAKTIKLIINDKLINIFFKARRNIMGKNIDSVKASLT